VLSWLVKGCYPKLKKNHPNPSPKAKGLKTADEILFVFGYLEAF
jgi:hypothetical protein